jgi:hypothetical protein
MRARKQEQYNGGWDDESYGDAAEAYDDDQDEQYAGGQYESEGEWYPSDDERGLVLQPENSLVGISNTVTHHGVPLLSYTRTMNRFYTTRKQRLSLGRHRCEVCGERIGWWAWVTENGTHTHDGCYERLAWTWTNLYAQQQHLATQGNLE